MAEQLSHTPTKISGTTANPLLMGTSRKPYVVVTGPQCSQIALPFSPTLMLLIFGPYKMKNTLSLCSLKHFSFTSNKLKA